MNDILFAWCLLVYLTIGLMVCFLLLRKACRDKKINTRNRTMDQYANDHAFEVLVIVFAWPLYLVALSLFTVYIHLTKKKNK